MIYHCENENVVRSRSLYSLMNAVVTKYYSILKVSLNCVTLV